MLGKNLEVFLNYAKMLIFPYNNVFVTHSQNKADVLKEFTGVYNR